MLLRKLVSAAVPVSVALVAFLHAHAIGALVDAAVTPASIAPFAEARAATAPPPRPKPKNALAILERNAFDHLAGPLTGTGQILGGSDLDLSDPLSAPMCTDVRALVTVAAEDPDVSFAALDVRGKRLLRGRGGDAGDLRLVYVAEDRVWLARDGKLCQSLVFGGTPSATTVAAAPGSLGAPGQTPLEKELAGKIVKTGPHEFQIDRGAVDRILAAQAELMKAPLLPEKEGDRVVGYRLVRIRAGSVLASLGLESGDRLDSIDGISVADPEGVMKVYARLSTGTLDRMTIHIVRGGKPVNLDYSVK